MTSALSRILFIRLHDPPTMMLRILLHLLWIPQQLQNLTRLRHIVPLPHPLIFHHAVPPPLQLLKVFDVHPRPTRPQDPSDMADIRRRDLLAHKIIRPGVLQMLLEHAVEASCFVDVALHPVLDLLRRIAHEVVRLPLHRADAAVLEEEPVVDFVVLLRAARVAEFALRVVFFGQVLKDGARFEEADGAAAVEGVGQGGDAAIGVDFEVPGFFLLVGAYVDVGCFVGEVEEGEHDGDFDAVGGLVCVEG